jgi:hypothetical protein
MSTTGDHPWLRDIDRSRLGVESKAVLSARHFSMDIQYVDDHLPRRIDGWYSPSLGLGMPIVSYGSAGKPILLFPSVATAAHASRRRARALAPSMPPTRCSAGLTSSMASSP